MSKKSLPEICKIAGLKFGESSEGAHVAANQHEPSGYWVKDAKTVLALEHYADQMEPKVGQHIKRLADLHREGEKLKKDREKAQAEKQKQAEAERQKRESDLRQKQEDDLRNTIRQANPGISDEEIETILPEMRRELLKQRTKTALINFQREASRKF